MDSASSPAPENGIVKVPQKRPRPVLSCLDCRRKKLKCSRTMPCVQCTKTGHASRCSYHEYPPSAPSSEAVQDVSCSEEDARARKKVSSKITELQKESPSTGSNTTLTSAMKLGIIEDLQNRVERLEHRLKTNAPNLNRLRDHEPDDDYRGKRHNVSTKGTVRLKDSATRYHGQNQKAALLTHVGIPTLR
jgi:hypothetical protein